MVSKYLFGMFKIFFIGYEFRKFSKIHLMTIY
jgi:hypothetical protein